jgi:hypothetical protein
MCFCIARLLVGLYAVRRWRTNSQPLDDPALLSLVASLRRAMGCRRSIEVREAADVGGPVTVGWRRPIVLLPPQWRNWDDDELRAVLAHEVAHIRRADYAAWLVARFSVALHFYHPLAHWLASRLHLQQELAADALGARHAGGRRAYVRALARLALRQEESVRAGPARAFLPVRETLMRRIAMLRTEEKSCGETWSRPLAVLLLGLIVLGVSALRDPAQAGEKPPTSSPEATPAPAPVPRPGVNRPPFEYCYCSPEAAGFYAFRPSVYFSADPRMKKFAGEIDKTIREMGGPESFPKIEEIEQISGCIFLEVNEKAPKGQRHMLISSVLILRTTGEYDWKKILESVAKKVVEGQCEGRTYYKVAASDLKSPVFFNLVAASMSRGDKAIYFFQPDKRTLAIGSEKQFQEMIRNGPHAKPAWAVAAGWNVVERGVFAAAITNQEQHFSKVWLASPPEEIPADVNTAVAKTTAMVFGMDYDDELRADLFAACANQEDAVAYAYAMLAWASKGQTTIREALEKLHDGDPRPLLGQKFLKQTSIGMELGAGAQKPAIVHAQGHVKVNLAELFGFVAGAKVQAMEVKDD